MKVILLQELKGKGGEGDVVEVAKGFANNFLFPQKIAVAATQGNLKQLEQRKKNIAKREANRLDDAEKVKAVLEGVVVRITAKVGEEGQLFGSVTSQMIADGLQQTAGLEVDKKRIDLRTPIKTAGEHEVSLSLYRDIKVAVKLFVCDEKDEIPVEEVAAKAAESAEGSEASENAEVATDVVAAEATEVSEEVKADETPEVAAEISETDKADDKEAEAEISEASGETVEAKEE